MNILILSRNPSLYSTQSIVDAARRRHHYVRVVDHMNCDLVIEEGKMAIYYHQQKLENIHAVIPRIGTTATSFGAAVIRQFESQGIFTTMGSEPLLRARDKLSCLQILAANGIRVPKTIVGNNFYSFQSQLELMGDPPYILKLANGTQGLGVMLSESKSNAESILEAFFKSEEQLLLQAFIAEAKGGDIRAFVVDGKIVGAMKRQAKAGEFRSNLHRGASAYSIDLTPEQSDTAIRAAELMGLKIAGVDMLLSNQGPMILEVNASPGLEGIEGATNIDIAGSIIQYVEKSVLI